MSSQNIILAREKHRAVYFNGLMQHRRDSSTFAIVWTILYTGLNALILQSITDIDISWCTLSVDDAQQSMSLFVFIHNVARLTGTKIMCGEGGCGLCVVTATYHHPGTKEEVTKAVNAVSIEWHDCVCLNMTTIRSSQMLALKYCKGHYVVMLEVVFW